MKTYYNHNGKLFEVAEPALSVFNHSYRYGDGLFETMKMVNKKIPLFNYHVERLFYSMQVLGFRVPVLFSKETIEKEIIKLGEKNNCLQLARVRVTVSRGNGAINDCNDQLEYTIECTAVDEAVNHLNENGFVIDIFPDGSKPCDKFSNLKSTSYLHYVMAARFAKENKLNDALILNQNNHICEATIANVFWLKNETVYTPPLSEGCVAGVMRKHLLEKTPDLGIDVEEKILAIEELNEAAEVFLTNAVYGMRWVKQFRANSYRNTVSQHLYNSLIRTLTTH